MLAQKHGMGYLRGLRDARDLTDEHDKIARILHSSEPLKSARSALPSAKSIAKGFTQVEDQLNIGSCTTNSYVGLAEFFQKQAFNETLHLSRLALYKYVRFRKRYTPDGTGDTGAYLRHVMGTAARVGVPEESVWPYIPEKFDELPDPFTIALGLSYRAKDYYRIDTPDRWKNGTIIETVKQFIAGNLPIMFGFSVFSTFGGGPDIPMPSSTDSLNGGHATVICGYDDNYQIGSHKGCLQFRNSWGTGWGDGGYGWMPYAYAEAYADDYWSLLSADFVGKKIFQ